MTNDLVIASRLDKDLAVFRARFRRCHRLLHFLAGRVLGDSERADKAVENCWLKASRNPPRLHYEGAFRSWLVRVLVDEALALHQATARGSNQDSHPNRFLRNPFGKPTRAARREEFRLKNKIRSGGPK